MIMSAHAAVGVITAAYAARVQYPVLDAGVRVRDEHSYIYMWRTAS